MLGGANVVKLSPGTGKLKLVLELRFAIADLY